LKEHHSIDLTIANGENAAGGIGLTASAMQELFASGIDLLTSGNHIWDKKEMVDVIGGESRLLRPANFPPETPGRGAGIFEIRGRTVGVLNLAGRLFMPPGCDCPFHAAEREMEILLQRTPVIIVDFHAEATSEKIALGWLLRDKASAVIGTHTHVQTADERILPGKAAYISDAGMVGPYDSILGLDPAEILGKFVTGLPMKWKIASGACMLCGVVVTIDEDSGKALRIQRVSEIDHYS
jgi:metallophosphoesterase (TIGR00282 family)